MEHRGFVLGMGQILVEGGEVERNLARARAMIADAARRDCQIVVLPECLDCGWTWPGTAEAAQPIPGPHCDALRAAARDGGIYVVAGLAERADDRVYNAAVLISPGGEILIRYRKINELTIAHPYYATGDRLRVVETPLGVLGVNICADNFPDSLVLGHSLARMGCEVLVSPCAWAVDADYDNNAEPYGGIWRESYGTLAKLYDMTVVGVSNVGWLRAGPWEGRKCIGCSLAVGPGGEVAAAGPYGEQAEALIRVEVRPQSREATGTAIAPLLRARGYDGP